MPGGESTCLRRLLKLFGLDESIRQAVRETGTKVWGTCAGAIILAAEVDGVREGMGVMDIAVQRNAFGSQLASFQTEARIPAVSDKLLPLTFIRAPKIIRAEEGVRVLLELDGYIAMAENEPALVTVFHPEMTPSLAFHRYFAEKCACLPEPMSEKTQHTGDKDTDESWNPTSWTRLAMVDAMKRNL